MRVLLVDDSQDVADMLKSLLEHAGHQVCCAYAGEEAVSAAAEFIPEAVCLDLCLPDMDGYQLAVRLREQPELAGARFVALTGSPAEPAKLAQAGIERHMLKPAGVADVLVALLGPRKAR